MANNLVDREPVFLINLREVTGLSAVSASNNYDWQNFQHTRDDEPDLPAHSVRNTPLQFAHIGVTDFFLRLVSLLQVI